MAFWSRRNEYDAYDSDGYYEEVEPAVTATSTTPEMTPPPAPAPATGTGLSLGGNNIELKVVRPESFEEVTTVADHLLAGCTVFLNLEATDKAVARRLMDFIGGVAYVHRCQIKPVSNTTYIISASNVDVTETQM